MKPLAEGFRVYSRSAPARELRPPKSSLARAPGEGRVTRRSGAHGSLALAVVTTLGALLLLVVALG